jgi:glycosyltransferase involved in cell wall biosynthesis
MHIAIATSPLTSEHRARGIGVYTKNLINALQKYKPEHTYSFFTRTQEIPSSADVVHYPYFDPFFLTLPLQKKKPTVVTVHDLIPLVFPEHFPSGMRGMMKWYIQRLSLKGAKRIVTDSQNSKHDIAKLGSIDENHIDVVYLASSVHDQPVTKENIEVIKKKLNITGTYFLYVGDINWNKNILGLLNAFSIFLLKNMQTAQHIQLVLVGSAFLHDAIPEAQEIRRTISELHLEQNIVMSGFVSEGDLVGLYHGAIGAIQPSHYEGFGLPILDAFTCMCPVIAADNSSMKEIMGSAIPVDSENNDDIVRGMQQLFGLSEKDRSIRIDVGSTWVKQFTWKRVAEETIVAYERSLR